MAPVGSKSVHTKPEVLLRQALWAEGLRYRLHVRTPVGKPDIVFPRQKVAVFVDGCFWHGCPDHYVRPRTRNEFWADKLIQNYTRDHRQTRELEALGWRVLRFWEHEVHVDVLDLVAQVQAGLQGTGEPRESLHVVQVDILTEDGSQERRVLRDIRNPATEFVVERPRTTQKWKQANRGKPTTGST